MKSLVFLFSTILVALLYQSKAFNLALGKDSKQSSTFHIYDSGLGVNGEMISRKSSKFVCAHTDNMADPSWWAVDLGDTYTISTITIYGRTDGYPHYLSNFDVDVIMDPNYRSCDKWATFQRGRTKNCHFQQNSIQYLNITCPTNTNGRFVRIKNRGHFYLVVCEVEVYGQPFPIDTAQKEQSVKTRGFVGKEYAGNTIRSFAARSRMDCVTYCINAKSCCAAEYQDAEKRCTLKTKADKTRDTSDLFKDAPGKTTFLIN